MKTNRFLLCAIALAAFTAPGEALAQRVQFFDQQRRAWLGFSYQPVSQAGDATGVVVLEVVENSPAERAGVETGDTIVRINEIAATDAFIASLGSALSPGEQVRVEIRRDGRTRTLNVTASEPPDDLFTYAAGATVLRLDGDSIRSLMRIMVDSVFADIDTLRMPRVMVRRGGRPFAFGSDTLRYDLMFRDTVFFGPDSLRQSVFIWSSGDSLRAEFDSLRTRLRLIEPFRYTLRDSMLSGGAIFVRPSDSTFTWRLDVSPFGVTSIGRNAIAGAELTRLDPAMEEYFGVSEGVLVVRVPRDTPASRAGLQAGDVIVRVNGTAVSTVDALRRAVARAQEDETTRLDVIRKRRDVTVELKRE